MLENHASNEAGIIQLHQKVIVLTNLYFNQELLFLQVSLFGKIIVSAVL